MEQINPTSLTLLDNPEGETGFDDDMDRWLANLTDIMNENLTIINTMIALGQVDVGGAMMPTTTVAVVGLLPGNNVFAQLISSTNEVQILKTSVTVPDSFNITFSADPGASAIIAYQAFAVVPQ